MRYLFWEWLPDGILFSHFRGTFRSIWRSTSLCCRFDIKTNNKLCRGSDKFVIYNKRVVRTWTNNALLIVLGARAFELGFARSLKTDVRNLMGMTSFDKHSSAYSSKNSDSWLSQVFQCLALSKLCQIVMQILWPTIEATSSIKMTRKKINGRQKQSQSWEWSHPLYNYEMLLQPGQMWHQKTFTCCSIFDLFSREKFFLSPQSAASRSIGRARREAAKSKFFILWTSLLLKSISV